MQLCVANTVANANRQMGALASHVTAQLNSTRPPYRYRTIPKVSLRIVKKKKFSVVSSTISVVVVVVFYLRGLKGRRGSRERRARSARASRGQK